MRAIRVTGSTASTGLGQTSSNPPIAKTLAGAVMVRIRGECLHYIGAQNGVAQFEASRRILTVNCQPTFGRYVAMALPSPDIAGSSYLACSSHGGSDHRQRQRDR